MTATVAGLKRPLPSSSRAESAIYAPLPPSIQPAGGQPQGSLAEGASRGRGPSGGHEDEEDEDDEDDESLDEDHFGEEDDDHRMAELLSRRREEQVSLAEALSLDVETTGILLRHCRGDHDRVLERYTTDYDSLLREAGVAPVRLKQGAAPEELAAAAELQPMLTLQLGDEAIEVPLGAARCCVTIANLLEDTDATAIPLPISCIDAASVRHVISYCSTLHSHGKLRANERWNKELLPALAGRPGVVASPDGASMSLVNLVRATAYLDQSQLMPLALQAAAERCLRHRSASEIRVALSLPDDLSVEESRAAEQENLFTPDQPEAGSSSLGNDPPPPTPSPAPPLVGRQLTSVQIDDDELLYHMVATLTPDEVRIVKGACRRLRSISRRVLCSGQTGVGKSSVLQLIKMGAPVALVRERLDSQAGIGASSEVNEADFPIAATPLGLATIKRDVELARILCERGADVNKRFRSQYLIKNAPNRRGHRDGKTGSLTPLECAISLSFHTAVELEMVELLLAYGASTTNLLHRVPTPPVVTRLIAAGADVNEAIPQFDPLASDYAPRFRFDPEAMPFLPQGGSSTWVRLGGWRPLHAAAAAIDVDAVRLLLQAGADSSAAAEVEFKVWTRAFSALEIVQIVKQDVPEKVQQLVALLR